MRKFALVVGMVTLLASGLGSGDVFAQAMQFGSGAQGQKTPAATGSSDEPYGTPVEVPLQFGAQVAHQDLVPRLTVDPNAPPGIAWLQKTPSTLFDLGMMELTRTANKAAEGLFDISGAVAVYRQEAGKISINFYAATAYSPQNCTYIARKMRAEMFPSFDNHEQMKRILSSYFVGFGPMQQTRPESIGAELLDGLSFVVFLPGGACELPIGGERLIFLKDDNYVPPKIDPQTEKEMPQIPDVTNLLGKALKQAGIVQELTPNENQTLEDTPTDDDRTTNGVMGETTEQAEDE